MKWWRTFGSVASALSKTPTPLAQRSGSDDLTGEKGGREHSKFNIETDIVETANQLGGHSRSTIQTRWRTAHVEGSNDGPRPHISARK
jgi:hypothetical protein